MEDKTLATVDIPSNKGKQLRDAIWKTRGDKTLETVDIPSNKGKQAGVQWETKGDNTRRKADIPTKKEVQWESTLENYY